MNSWTLPRFALPLVCVAAIPVASVHAEDPGSSKAKPVSVQQIRRGVDRGLDFLVKDANKWRQEKKCVSCHHGAMTVWALSEAKRQGYAVASDAYSEFTKWTEERLKGIDKPRDTRPGWSMVNSPALVLANMALAIPAQEALSAEEIKQIVGHLLRHQEKDGSWAWSSAPPVNRPPPFFESDEVATLLALMAIGPHVPASPSEKSEIREARDRGLAWLSRSKPNDTTQAAALRLLFRVRAGESAKSLQPLVDRFLHLQQKDGGWGQVPGGQSDAYATGQALYVLNLAGIQVDRPEIQRGLAFLVATQNDDGSWPMTRRGHPGVTPGPFKVPITYFGSAWATLGLMRSVKAGKP
jgi:hypothetical protein